MKILGEKKCFSLDEKKMQGKLTIAIKISQKVSLEKKKKARTDRIYLDIPPFDRLLRKEAVLR